MSVDEKLEMVGGETLKMLQWKILKHTHSVFKVSWLALDTMGIWSQATRVSNQKAKQRGSTHSKHSIKIYTDEQNHEVCPFCLCGGCGLLINPHLAARRPCVFPAVSLPPLLFLYSWLQSPFPLVPSHRFPWGLYRRKYCARKDVHAALSHSFLRALTGSQMLPESLE